VDDREQRHRARDRRRLLAGGRLERLQLAAVAAVDDFPSARAELLAESVGCTEVALPPALDALGEQPLGLVSV
jgi:hypothetical protein